MAREGELQPGLSRKGAIVKDIFWRGLSLDRCKGLQATHLSFFLSKQLSPAESNYWTTELPPIYTQQEEQNLSDLQHRPCSLYGSPAA